jgi:hypothetical protein
VPTDEATKADSFKKRIAWVNETALVELSDSGICAVAAAGPSQTSPEHLAPIEMATKHDCAWIIR